MNTYNWDITLKSETRAICKNKEGHILHDLLVYEKELSYEEALEQSSSLIKMTAYKDIMSTSWSHFEAAIYGVSNTNWLEKRVLDASRKRWGAKHYLAEMWLLAAQAHLNMPLDYLDIIDDTKLRDKLVNLLSNKDGVHHLVNWLSLITNASPFNISSWWDEENNYIELNATFIQNKEINSEIASIFLKDNGEWVLAMPTSFVALNKIKFLTISEPPGPDNVLFLHPEINLDDAIYLSQMQ